MRADPPTLSPFLTDEQVTAAQEMALKRYLLEDVRPEYLELEHGFDHRTGEHWFTIRLERRVRFADEMLRRVIPQPAPPEERMRADLQTGLANGMRGR